MLELALIGTFVAVLLLILVGMHLARAVSLLQDATAVPIILRAMMSDPEVEDVHQPKRWRDMLPKKQRIRRRKVRPRNG